MQKENSIVLTGTYKEEQVTPTFKKQVLTFASKDRDGNWKDGDFECYIKPELVQSSGIQPGDTMKIAGFMVFNFFTKSDGTTLTFPKMIVTEVREREAAGAGQYQQTQMVQPTQPTGYAQGVPPTPGGAPAAPQVGGMPPMPPAPGVMPA